MYRVHLSKTCSLLMLFRALGSPAERLLVADERCLIALYENVVPNPQALFESVRASAVWSREVDDFGEQDRETCYVGDAGCTFAFVGLTLRPRPWTPAARALRHELEGLIAPRVRALAGSGSAAAPLQLSGCLMNRYDADAGFIPWHSDEVRAHGPSRVVCAVSLGGPRRFLVRAKPKAPGDEPDPPVLHDIALPSGSALLMAGDAQARYEHALPLDVGAAPARISLTYRSIVPGFEEERAHTQAPIPGSCQI